MAEEKHPYMGSKGPIIQLITQLRNSFPSTLDASTLKKLGIGPNNEGVLLNVLRFVGIIDDDGKKSQSATKIFSHHDDSDFQKNFSELVKNGYSELFELYGEKAWELDSDSLIKFFRQHDQTSAITGKRQAVTFQALSSLCGHVEMPGIRNNAKSKVKDINKVKISKSKTVKESLSSDLSMQQAVVSEENLKKTSTSANFGLTVRVEINLPSDGDQETYDRIFRSIKENLLNG
jgi:Family of unknown function (DUF5343)